MTPSDIIILALYALIGMSGALAIIIFVWGFVVYILRIGLVSREDGIHIMEWGVRFILTAIALIATLRLLSYWWGLS